MIKTVETVETMIKAEKSFTLSNSWSNFNQILSVESLYFTLYFQMVQNTVSKFQEYIKNMYFFFYNFTFYIQEFLPVINDMVVLCVNIIY